jgi:hypothetical protein
MRMGLYPWNTCPRHDGSLGPAHEGVEGVRELGTGGAARTGEAGGAVAYWSRQWVSEADKWSPGDTLNRCNSQGTKGPVGTSGGSRVARQHRGGWATGDAHSRRGQRGVGSSGSSYNRVCWPGEGFSRSSCPWTKQAHVNQRWQRGAAKADGRQAWE